MSVDVVVAVPAFMDMTFVGLEGLPGLGEERFAGDLVRSPGGGAVTAIGTARLGLATALDAPLGGGAASMGLSPALAGQVGVNPPGNMSRQTLEEDGVQIVGPPCPRSRITMVMP